MIIRVWYNYETISRQMQIQGGEGEESEGKKYGIEKEIKKKGTKKGGKDGEILLFLLEIQNRMN